MSASNLVPDTPAEMMLGNLVDAEEYCSDAWNALDSARIHLENMRDERADPYGPVLESIAADLHRLLFRIEQARGAIDKATL